VAEPPFNVLLSFHYHGRRSIPYFLEATFGPDLAGWPRVVVDSGAVTASNFGVTINMLNYSRWVKQADDHVAWAANLDVIGDWRRSAANMERLERMGMEPVPVFHNGSPVKELERLCEAHDRVAIGGMVRKGQPYTAALPFLTKCHVVAAKHNTLLHGFGMTRWSNILEFPWDSVDSSSWSMGHRNGKMFLWDGTGLIQIHWSEAKRYAPLIEAHGGDPNAIVERYHYKRVAGVSGVAWVRMERALQRARPGFKLHLVDSNDRSMYFVRQNLERMEGGSHAQQNVDTGNAV
jgi:hypothetical protein